MSVTKTPPGAIFSNWSETEHCVAKRYFEPSSEQEICDLVARFEQNGETVRVVGAGHAFSPVVLTDRNLLSLDGMRSSIKIDQEKMQVTVQAGMHIFELNELLATHGLAMRNLGSIAQQSIAGAASTGTHGTGITLGNISTQIIALNVVTGGGQLKSFTLNNPEMLAARQSLGCLGILTQVTIQCVPAFRLKSISFPMRFEEALSNLDLLLNQFKHMRFYWLAGTEIMQVIGYNPTEEPLTPHTVIGDVLEEVVLKHDAYGFLIRAGYLIPGLVNPVNEFVAKVGFQKATRVDRSDRILNISMPPLHDECEYAVPVERAAEAIRETREMVERYHLKMNIPLEVRFVAADENMISPTYKRAACHIGAYTFGAKFSQEYFDDFEALMKTLEGRPHWGKRLTLTGDEARKMYPMYGHFVQIRRQLDPKNTFTNAFTRRIFA